MLFMDRWPRGARGVRRAAILPALAVAAFAAGTWTSALESQAPDSVRSLAAQITGVVRSGGRPVSFAQVFVAGGTIRGMADSLGRYKLVGVVAGNITVTARAIGFSPRSQIVELASGDSVAVDFDLVPTASTLQAIVTSATLRETYVSESPVKVEVIAPSFLRRNVTNNLMENISFVNGLNQQVDCGVCFTNNIRINGMEGPYTAVLIDGAPMMSSLATVYGLNSIDPTLIEQIEIMRGPSSTLYGSEAMGGVINIVTKDARFAPRLSVNAFATSNGETALNVAGARAFGKAHTILSLNGGYNDRFVDRNNDAFSDLPLVRRLSVFNKWAIGSPVRRPFEIAARYYFEDRFGGTSAWTSKDRGSSETYGESIVTRRAEVIGSARFGADRAPARFDFAANWHDQNSFYGDQPYMATQIVAFGQLFWAPQVGQHTWGIGGGARWQSYVDSTRFHQTDAQHVIPGVFAQDEIALSANWTVLAGMRLDHHELHGVIPSPRLALKWTADPHTTVRLNAATGFRVVNLFTEDHAALTGAREVQITEELRPERSATITASLNRVFDIANVEDAATLDLDAYYTRFSNRILPDFGTDPNLIIYRNLRGRAETRGIAAAFGFATMQQPVFANLGVTLEEVFSLEEGQRQDVLFAPRFQGVFTVGYKLTNAGMTVDWTGRVLGPMPLPQFPDLASRSSWFTEQHVQVTKAMRQNAELYVAVKNLFDYVQRDPIVDPSNPFGDRFDTTRVFGPLQGRRLLLGLRHVVPR
jgi:outer membrane receptor for ferrienterochelin and colicins